MIYVITEPGLTSRSGQSNIGSPFTPFVARIIPWLSIPIIIRGSRFAIDNNFPADHIFRGHRISRYPKGSASLRRYQPEISIIFQNLRHVLPELFLPIRRSACLNSSMVMGMILAERENFVILLRLSSRQTPGSRFFPLDASFRRNDRKNRLPQSSNIPESGISSRLAPLPQKTWHTAYPQTVLTIKSG